MKQQFYSLCKAAVAVLVFTFVFGQSLQAQENETIYLEITKLKSGDDFMDVENEIVKPFVQERIKQGNLMAWVLYKVMYPRMENAEYDYVAMEVVNNFDHLNISQKEAMGMAANVWPDTDLQPIVKRYDDSAENVGSEVFVLRDEAVEGGPEKGSPRKYVQVNHMKVSEANSRAYAKMESEIFKPVHQDRAKNGTMSEWLLCQRILPYGSEWDNNFITMDFYENWSDMVSGGGDFKKVHPNKDPGAIWEKMSKLRELRRAETWEIVMVVNKPAEEVTYNVVKEGSGDSPMRGHEVTYRGNIMNSEGETMVSSEILGFDFYHTIGSDPNARHLDKCLLQMKKGGTMTMTLPPDAQDKVTKSMMDGENAVIKVEMVDFGEAKPDGAAMLQRKIEAHGLSTAKAKYQKLQSDNSKGYVFREDKMNMLGYQLLEKGMTDAAIWVFETNTKLYPKSWNACDSLADGYRAVGNYAKAKHCYKMALAINPDFQAAKNKLEKL